MPFYGQHFSTRSTPQSEPMRADQVVNNAGGFVWTLDKWARLDRWLILGAEGGTYYASERKMVRANTATVIACLDEDGQRTVARIVEVSDSGRAPKNDPAIFALAIAAGHANEATRKAALAALPKVCRIGTHLFHFARDVQGFRKWGRALRTAVAKWYTDRSVDKVAMQAIKYAQRDGFSHRDLLRLSHPKAPTPQHDAAFRWIVGGADALAKEGKRGPALDAANLPALLVAFDRAQTAATEAEVVSLITEHSLPREALPTKWLNSPKVWEAMLPHMGSTACIRNLAKMTAVGLLGPMGDATRAVCVKLTDAAALTKDRVHPIAVLLAQSTYASGHGDKGKLTWSPCREIVDALDDAFYASFSAVEPTGRRHMLALDVSGSMWSGGIAGTRITPHVASAAMAMVTARTERDWCAFGFTANGRGYGGMHGGGTPGFTPLSISPRQRIDDVCKTVAALPMGGTDCALPMMYAMGNKIPVDAFVVYTDNETWAGATHPMQALKAYRDFMGIPAKLIVVGMTATEFTIADPNDAGAMDVVGFDSSAPAVMADFVRGAVAPAGGKA